MDILNELFTIADEQKQAKALEEKKLPLSNHIMEECKRQNYTIYEFEKLILAMVAVLEEDKKNLHRKTLLFREDLGNENHSGDI